MTVGVPAVTVKSMSGILQPVITLFFQKVFVNENMVKNNDDLKDLESIQQFAKVKYFLSQNEVAFCKYHY